MASFGVGTKGSVTISSLVSWMGLVTGGWAVVVVLVVEIVRVGADEVKTTLDGLAAATSSAGGAALVPALLAWATLGVTAWGARAGRGARVGARRTCVEEQRRRGQKSRSLPLGS